MLLLALLCSCTAEKPSGGDHLPPTGDDTAAVPSTDDTGDSGEPTGDGGGGTPTGDGGTELPEPVLVVEEIGDQDPDLDN